VSTELLEFGKRFVLVYAFFSPCFKLNNPGKWHRRCRDSFGSWVMVQKCKAHRNQAIVGVFRALRV